MLSQRHKLPADVPTPNIGNTSFFFNISDGNKPYIKKSDGSISPVGSGGSQGMALFDASTGLLADGTPIPMADSNTVGTRILCFMEGNHDFGDGNGSQFCYQFQIFEAIYVPFMFSYLWVSVGSIEQAQFPQSAQGYGVLMFADPSSSTGLNATDPPNIGDVLQMDSFGQLKWTSLPSGGLPSATISQLLQHDGSSFIPVNYLKDVSGYKSMDWQNRQLFNDVGQIVLNWDFGSMVDNTNNPALSWFSRYLFDSSGNMSVDWNNRQLKDENGNITVDWNNDKLTDSFSRESVNWDHRYLFGIYGNIVVDWQSLTLNNNSGTTAIDWDGNVIIYDSFGRATINSNNHQLYNSSNTPTIDWESCALVDPSTGHTSVSWNNKVLKNGSNDITVDWENEQLKHATSISVNWGQKQLHHAGNVALDWDNKVTYDASGATTIDWANRKLQDPFTYTSLNWASRILENTGGITTLNWNEQRLFSTSGTVMLDWGQSILRDNSGGRSLAWANRIAYDIFDEASIDYQQRQLYDTNGGQCISWVDRILYDSVGLGTLDWSNRIARKNNGYDNAFLWGNGFQAVGNWSMNSFITPNATQTGYVETNPNANMRVMDGAISYSANDLRDILMTLLRDLKAKGIILA